MSASKKPQAGEPIALSAAALSDAYRAADIVLGKDGGFSARVDEKKLNCITVQENPPGTYTPDYKVGDAIVLENLMFGDPTTNQTSVDNESDLIKFEQGSRFICKVSGNTYKTGSNFGIVRNKTIQRNNSNVPMQMLKVQVRGLVVCRCLLFASAEAVGPPVQTDLPEYAVYNYPVGNYYGDAKIIARGRHYEITEQPFPRVQECLIDLG